MLPKNRRTRKFRTIKQVLTIGQIIVSSSKGQVDSLIFSSIMITLSHKYPFIFFDLYYLNTRVLLLGSWSPKVLMSLLQLFFFHKYVNTYFWFFSNQNLCFRNRSQIISHLRNGYSLALLVLTSPWIWFVHDHYYNLGLTFVSLNLIFFLL